MLVQEQLLAVVWLGPGRESGLAVGQVRLAAALHLRLELGSVGCYLGS